ncbi:hypothetical protein BU17DRAFT_69950 [Hysterangium stoloniferum]|nr:hypothetical protein BU17DRAFT_69950 [Hysterangium stoloniferum]
MVSLKPGYKTNPYIISNISETISNIPLHIGVRDLKAVAYFTLLPLFTKWSKNQPLSINDLWLCFKDWVELIPLGSDNEDINISYESYTKALDCLEELQNEKIVVQEQSGKMKISYITESEYGNDSSKNLFDSKLMTPTLPSSMGLIKYINAAKNDMGAPPRKRQLLV